MPFPEQSCWHLFQIFLYMLQLRCHDNLPTFSRRTFLRIVGMGTLAAGVSFTDAREWHPNIYCQDSLSLPYRASQALQVVIIGGGLAGLAAAYELSQRGVKVTILEQAPRLGGKVASWPIQVGSHQMMMEHGFHGFFPHYYNLFSLVDELSIQSNFRSLDYYSVVYKENYQPEVFRPSQAAFPWNIAYLAIASRNRMKWGINLLNLKHLKIFREIVGFQNPKSFERLDKISAAAWIQENSPKGLYDLYFLPFAKSSLNAPDCMSAAELMQYFHFYFFGNPEGLAFKGTRQDIGRSLVNPLVKAIENNGGRVVTGATISSLFWEARQIKQVTYQTGSIEAHSVPFWVKRNPLLSSDVVEYFGSGDRLFSFKPGGEEALSLRCTHQGCTVQRTVAIDDVGSGYHCPCHGALYNAEGQSISGPAQEALMRYEVLRRNGDSIQLVANAPAAIAATTETLAADYCILAADIPGVKHLLSLSEGAVEPAVLAQSYSLQVAAPFAVVRFWFDRDFEWEHSWFTSLSGYRLTDSIALYHHIQDDYITWAKNTGGSVVELHAYCYKEAEFLTQEILLSTFEAELYDIVPALKGAQILHKQLVNQKNFAGFPPGSFANRPQTASAAANLLFAGDWVKIPFPCELMERAVSSGLLAANLILHRGGIQRRRLYSIKPEGILKI